MTCLVIALSSPSGPVSSSPLARAALTSSRTAARSTSAGVSDFFAALSSGLTPTSVSVIIRPFPLNQSARWASYTVTRTVSRLAEGYAEVLAQLGRRLWGSPGGVASCREVAHWSRAPAVHAAPDCSAGQDA